MTDEEVLALAGMALLAQSLEEPLPDDAVTDPNAEKHLGFLRLEQVTREGQSLTLDELRHVADCARCQHMFAQFWSEGHPSAAQLLAHVRRPATFPLTMALHEHIEVRVCGRCAFLQRIFAILPRAEDVPSAAVPAYAAALDRKDGAPLAALPTFVVQTGDRLAVTIKRAASGTIVAAVRSAEAPAHAIRLVLTAPPSDHATTAEVAEYDARLGLRDTGASVEVTLGQSSDLLARFGERVSLFAYVVR